MPKDVICYWAHGGVPNDIRNRAAELFAYPIAFVEMPAPPLGPPNKDGRRPVLWNNALDGLGPRPINEVIRRANITPQRIAILGFSASCTPQRLALASGDGGYIDTAIAIDGIHDGVKVWSDFARIAAFGGAEQRGMQPGSRCCVITHSQVQPEYTSTTETAQQIVEDVFGGVVTHEDPEVSPMLTRWLTEPVTIGCSWHPNRYTYDQMPFWYQVNKGGLHVIGYENKDPTGCSDHIFQAKIVLARALEFILAPRWRQPPPTGTCVVSTTV